MSKVKNKKIKRKKVFEKSKLIIEKIENKIMHLFVGLKNAIQTCSVNG